MWVHHFTVKGNARFPVDMLRYDQCWPTSQDDILIAFGPLATRIVRLTHWDKRKDWKPEEGRWESFQWPVLRKEEPFKL